MFNRLRVGVLMAAAGVLLAGPAARAADPSAVERAKRYIQIDSRARGILAFAHPSARFKSLELVQQTDVRSGRTGQLIPGAFCLHYRFRWRSELFNDNHWSDVKIFFSDRGRVLEVQGGRTSTFVPPFTAANVVMEAIKDALLRRLANDPPAQRRVRQLIANADAKGLLTFILQLDQR